jgi:hypothetical protein
MHQTVTNVLRTLVHTNPPQNMTQARDITDDALATFAGNVGFSNVKKMVELTDTCVLARHVANMSANMLATRPKTVSAEVLTMSSRHVAYGYVDNMLAYVGNMLAACYQVEHI